MSSLMLPVKQPFTNTKADGGPVGGRKAARQKVRSPSQQPKGENKKMTFEKYNANPDRIYKAEIYGTSVSMFCLDR